MSLASLGWATWWIALFLLHFAPEFAPGIKTTSILACSFATIGFLFALYSFRAKLAWLLITAIPLFANGSLLLLPVVIKTLRVIRAEQTGVIDPAASGPHRAHGEEKPRQG